MHHCNVYQILQWPTVKSNVKKNKSITIYNGATVNLQCVIVNLQWSIVNPLQKRKHIVKLTVNFVKNARLYNASL